MWRRSTAGHVFHAENHVSVLEFPARVGLFSVYEERNRAATVQAESTHHPSQLNTPWSTPLDTGLRVIPVHAGQAVEPTVELDCDADIRRSPEHDDPRLLRPLSEYKLENTITRFSDRERFSLTSRLLQCPWEPNFPRKTGTEAFL